MMLDCMKFFFIVVVAFPPVHILLSGCESLIMEMCIEIYYEHPCGKLISSE